MEKTDSDERNNVFLKLASTKDNSVYIADDFFLVSAIEHTHKILLSDYIGQIARLPDINLKIEYSALKNDTLNGQPVSVISQIEKIYPDYPDSEQYFNYSELNPGQPAADYYHRYIDVPVVYGDPSQGTFQLYYELCSDYDENKPTILIPTDGQRTLSQVDWADRYKEIFDLDYNTVTYEYRGMYCSDIPAINDRNLDWRTAYEILKSDHVVEDIERIRQDLMGDKSIYLLGGSGTAMIGLKYLEKYHQHVERAFLMSFFKDAVTSSTAGVRYFHNFLTRNKLYPQYRSAVANHAVDEAQLLFLIQRLLYYDEDEVVQLLNELSQNRLERYRQYSEQFGSLDYFVRSAWKYKPWSVVFMYETNISTSMDSMPDINYPFLKMAEPVTRAFGSEATAGHQFNIENLENITTEILLVGGTLDQVVPIEELEAIHARLPNSKLAVFEAYHCLEAPEQSRTYRNELANLFFRYGHSAPELLETFGRLIKKPTPYPQNPIEP
ncbi:MAG: alpha/beta fold hydrolase, partial [Fidelibacterota bacterium]